MIVKAVDKQAVMDSRPDTQDEQMYACAVEYLMNRQNYLDVGVFEMLRGMWEGSEEKTKAASVFGNWYAGMRLMAQEIENFGDAYRREEGMEKFWDTIKMVRRADRRYNHMRHYLARNVLTAAACLAFFVLGYMM